VLRAGPGGYITACKPGMVGEGIRAPFAISDSGEDVAPTGSDVELVEQANQAYQAYVKDQTEQLVAKTEEFVGLYKAAKDDEARALYAPARMHWERIETVAESFGDLDPKMDIREADLEPGQEFTGWHRIEKDLWPARAKGYKPLSTADRAKYADDLLANTNTLYDKTRDLTFTTDQIANGSRGLLDEVATGKVTGEEEYWSRTDLWDFQANVDGARVAFDGLRPILKTKDTELDTQIDRKFVALQGLLDGHRSGDGFKYYNELSAAEVKQLSDAVNALSEPLSQLSAAVI
jgi:iron uptake system component EfeO